MNISIKQLRAFLAVAQLGSFAEASECVHLSQPALSIAIRKLEREVGGPLFARTTRHVALTPEGASFYPAAVRLLNDWTEAFDDLSERFQMKRGKLTLAALPTLASAVLPATVAVFRERHPRINLSIHDILADQVTQLVREGRADIGFSVPPADVDEFNFEHLIRDQFVVVCPTDHPLLANDRVEWSMLTQFPFIGISRLSSSRQHIDQIMSRIGERLSIICDANQIGTVGRMVAAGIGISVLPALSFRQIAGRGLGYRRLTEPEVARDLGIITRRRHPLSATAVEFLHLLRSGAKDQGLWNLATIRPSNAALVNDSSEP